MFLLFKNEKVYLGYTTEFVTMDIFNAVLEMQWKHNENIIPKMFSGRKAKGTAL